MLMKEANHVLRMDDFVLCESLRWKGRLIRTCMKVDVECIVLKLN